MTETALDKCQKFFDEMTEREAPPPFTRSARIVFDPAEDSSLPFTAVLYRLKPGQKGPKHHHENGIEIYVVLSGSGAIVIDGVQKKLGKDSLLYVPPNMFHETVSHGPEDLLILGIFIPPVDVSEIKDKWTVFSAG